MPRFKAFAKQLLPNWLKRALAKMLRRIYEPPASIKSLIAFRGRFRVKVEGKYFSLFYKDRWIERDLFWKGISGYEKESVKIWINSLKEAKTVIDIGANSGLFSLLTKTLNNAAEVYAFEPLPVFKNDLIANCTLNQFNIHVQEYALSDFTGKAKFYFPQQYAGNIYSSSLSKQHYFEHQSTKPDEIDVEVTSFDAFAHGRNITSVDLVKIDAEGHDFEVLEGMKETIIKYQPDFLVEIQSDEIGKKIMKVLPPSTYLYFNINESKGIRRVMTLTQSDTLNFFICKLHTANKLNLI
jgi:FkbM family methyltransferase